MPMSNTTLVVAESANVTQNHVADDGLMVGTNITYNDAANSIDEECGLEVKVGCVLANTAEDESPLDCNSYIPKTAQDCFMQVRYTYHVDKDDKLSGMKLVSALRIGRPNMAIPVPSRSRDGTQCLQSKVDIIGWTNGREKSSIFANRNPL